MADRTALALLAGGLVLRSKAAVTPVGWPAGRAYRNFFPLDAWQRNLEVDPVGSLVSYPPIFACVTRIAADIGKLGLMLLNSDASGIPELAESTSPYWSVLRKPNSYQTLPQFIRQWLLSKLLFGNTYVVKARDGRGIVVALYILDPRGVTPLVTPDGSVYYSISGDQLAQVPLGMRAAPSFEVIHDRGPTLWHPLVGVSPLFAAALSGTLGQRIQRNSTTFFNNMSRPSGMLTAPGTIDEVTAERLKREWNENFSGANLGKLAVLGDGLEYQAMTIAAEQSQLVQQLGVTAIDVATSFGMPAYKINQGPMPTNNNIQALNQQYYNDCLQTHIEDIEACLNYGLGAPLQARIPAELSVEFDLEGLLRMDSLTQMDELVKGVGGGVYMPDEARRRKRLKPVPGGDAVYLQQQNFSLAAIAKRDAKPDPFETSKSSTPAPAPAPATPPAADSKAIEDLLSKALESVRESGERAAAAEQRQREADAAREADALAVEALATGVAKAFEDAEVVSG